MKKLIGVIVVVAILFGGYNLFFKNKSSTPAVTDNSQNPSSTTETSAPVKPDQKILERLRNVTVTASEDGGTVTLSGGEGEFKIDGSSNKGTVAVGNVASDTTVGSRKDIVSYITVNPGNGQYLVLFEDKGASIVQKSLVFLGNNITVKSIVVSPIPTKGGPEYIISVKGLEKGFDTTFIYTVVGGEIDVAKAIKL